jgi:aminoglycoside phosphotransferase (APT) family kinase protein
VLATAHDMGREYRVITALRDTSVPVPLTYALCTDPEVIGAPFYVMSRVDGIPYRTEEEITPLGPERTRAIAWRMIETLALLHAVQPAEVGLADFGRPEGFLPRQVRRWKKQLDASRSRPVAGIDELHELLAANQPESTPATIVHGDYRLDNLLVGPDDKIAAVVDWEMATLGDPLADLGLTLVYWTEDGEEGWLTPAGSPAGTRGVTADATASPGFWTRAEFAAEYARLTGRDVSRIGYYVAFGYFKLAVVLEGIHARYQQGKTVGEGFEQEGFAVPLLIARAHEVLNGEPKST